MPTGMSIIVSATLMVILDGCIQDHQTFVSVGQSYEDEEPGKPIHRVEVGWALPTTGLVFDGRPHVGTDRRFNVAVVAYPSSKMPPPPGEVAPEWASELPHIVHRSMQLRSFEISQKADRWAYARGVFTCNSRE